MLWVQKLLKPLQVVFKTLRMWRRQPRDRRTRSCFPKSACTGVLLVLLLNLLVLALSGPVYASGAGSVLPIEAASAVSGATQSGNSAAQSAVAPVGKALAQTVKTAAPTLETAAKTVKAAATPVVETARQGVSKTAAPVLKTAAPVLKTAAAVVETAGAPVLKTAAPVLKTMAPVLKTVAPVLDTTERTLAKAAAPVLQTTTHTIGYVVAPVGRATTSTVAGAIQGVGGTGTSVSKGTSQAIGQVIGPTDSPATQVVSPTNTGAGRVTAPTADKGQATATQDRSNAPLSAVTNTTAPTTEPASSAPPSGLMPAPRAPRSVPASVHDLSIGLAPALPGQLAWAGSVMESLATPATPHTGSDGRRAGAPPSANVLPTPAPSPLPGGSSGAMASTAGAAFAIFLTLAGLLLMGGLAAMRLLRLASEPWRRAPFVLIPERPG
jgi:hypothetical protein